MIGSRLGVYTYTKPGRKTLRAKMYTYTLGNHAGLEGLAQGALEVAHQ
jgi:hypothetical protein